MASPQSDIALSRLLSWVPDLPEGDNYRLLIESMVDQIAELFDIVIEIIESFDVQDAVGDQLDKIGAILRLARSGFNDDDYRRNIFVRIETIKSKLNANTEDAANSTGDPGSVNKIIELVRLFIGPLVPGDIIYTLIPPYNFKLQIPGAITATEIQELFNFIKQSIYAGVLGFVVFTLGGTNLWATALDDQEMVISVNEAGIIFTDMTSEFADNTGAADFEPFISEFAVDAYCAFGFTTPWQDLYFNHRSPSVDGDPILDIFWEYWNGVLWTSLPNLNDGTDSMTSSNDDQLVTFDIPNDWATTSIDGNVLYWVRAYINNSGAGNSPTYINGTLGGDALIPIGQWDVGAVVDEGVWATAQGSATQVWSVSADELTFVDLTAPFNNDTQGDILFFTAENALNAYVAFGFEFPWKDFILDNLSGVLGTNGIVTWEYWDGLLWQTVPGFVDGSNSFTNASNPVLIELNPTVPSWSATSLNGENPQYYVRARITTIYIVLPAYTQGVLNWPLGCGIWDVAAVPDEAQWSGVLSTGGSNSPANTNT